MAEHLFLCGLSKAQRAPYPRGRVLHLHGPNRNVRLRLDDVRKRLLEVEPELLTDLAEIATYVFAADCAIRRGGPTLKRMGQGWRRTFRLVIGVRQPAKWRQRQRLSALRDVLQFLSEDTWLFDFEPLEDPPGIQTYLGIAGLDADKSGGTTIMLFSGGLDSFAGAVHELNTSNRHVVLVSRRLGGMTDKRQRELADDLKSRYRRRVTHVPVEAGLTKETEADEETQRTRSFLFTAIAMVAAVIEESDRVRFYENGIMGVNLPLSTNVVGARASRSTHPRSLLLLNDLAKLVWDDEIKIDNPFAKKTKVEVVQELMARPERASIRFTLSCSRTREISTYNPHCGKCAQCIQRRISTLGAGAVELDPESGYAVDLLIGARQNGEDRQIAIDMIRTAVEFRLLSDAGFAQSFADEFGWLTSSLPGLSPGDPLLDFIAMFRRHGNAVRSIFVQATGEHKAALFDKSLPQSCLLRAWYEASGQVLIPLEKNLDPPSDDDTDEGAIDQDIETSDILLAINEERQQVLFNGMAPIKHPTHFRILAALVRRHVEDRENGLLPENFRTMPAAELASEASKSGDVAGRKDVSRLRELISEDLAALYGTLDLNAVIQNVPRKGYRLNPYVRVVSASELTRRG